MPIELNIAQPPIVRKEITKYGVNKTAETLSVSWGYFDAAGNMVREEDYTWPLLERDEQGQIVRSSYTQQEYQINRDALYRESVYHGVITQEEADNA